MTIFSLYFPRWFSCTRRPVWITSPSGSSTTSLFSPPRTTSAPAQTSSRSGSYGTRDTGQFLWGQFDPIYLTTYFCLIVQGGTAVLRHEQLPAVWGQAAAGADHCQDQLAPVSEGILCVCPIEKERERVNDWVVTVLSTSWRRVRKRKKHPRNVIGGRKTALPPPDWSALDQLFAWLVSVRSALHAIGRHPPPVGWVEIITIKLVCCCIMKEHFMVVFKDFFEKIIKLDNDKNLILCLS